MRSPLSKPSRLGLILQCQDVPCMYPRMFRNVSANLRQFGSLSWPALRADDSETLRRNKLGVRGLNGVLIGMVVVLSLVLAREFAVRELWLKLVVTEIGVGAYLVWALLGVIPFTGSVLRP